MKNQLTLTNLVFLTYLYTFNYSHSEVNKNYQIYLRYSLICSKSMSSVCFHTFGMFLLSNTLKMFIRPTYMFNHIKYQCINIHINIQL